jgi:hypothetical protein
MKAIRIAIIATAVLAAALAGAVMMGTADAGKVATYYACSDATTGALRRVPAEERCAEGEERLVWSDGQPEPTPGPGATSCDISFSGAIFVKNIVNYAGFDAVPVNDAGCAPTWTGMTNVTFKITITLNRKGGSPGWIEKAMPLFNSSFTSGTKCNGPEWGCPEIQGLNDGAVQMNTTYGDCKSGYDPCTMTVSYDAMATLKEGTNVYLWIATNRPKQPGDDGSWSTWDPTILGSTLKVTGQMSLQQVKP